jgi:hypothetical protein
MSPIQEFAAFDGKTYAAATRRVYLAAAKKALKLVAQDTAETLSHEELRDLLRENMAQKRLPKALKVGPFLAFLESKIPRIPVETPSYEPIRNWVLERIEDETKSGGRNSIQKRRDLAMLAGLCASPGRGSPRHWPKKALTVTRQGGGYTVKLWDRTVTTPGLVLALLYWDTWRQRLDRPDQSRIYRKDWAYSDLLFPDSRGGVMKKWAMHDALKRLAIKGEDRVVRLTPELVRQAFLKIAAPPETKGKPLELGGRRGGGDSLI